MIKVHELIHCPNNFPSMLSSHYILAEILVPLESQTVLLGQEAHFFCQILGRYQNLTLRIDGSLTSLANYNIPGNITVTTENGTSVEGELIKSININIIGSIYRNNTILECYDSSLGRENSSKAILTVQGRESVYSLQFYFIIIMQQENQGCQR